MVKFTDTTPAGLKAIDEYLLAASYLDGVEPSQEDVTTAKMIPAGAVGDYANLARWFKHIVSFSDIETAAFPGDVGEAKVESKAAPAAADDDDDFDPFGDDDEDDEAYKEQQKRAEEALKAKEKRDADKAAAGKKKEDPKSQIIFDIKPWDDETDLALMEKSVREIEIDGATWGAAKKVPIGYGINKLQMLCTIYDNKVPSTEIIEEAIVELEDYVQSVDVAAFNKL